VSTERSGQEGDQTKEGRNEGKKENLFAVRVVSLFQFLIHFTNFVNVLVRAVLPREGREDERRRRTRANEERAGTEKIESQRQRQQTKKKEEEKKRKKNKKRERQETREQRQRQNLI
jgi:hypothetical protein